MQKYLGNVAILRSAEKVDIVHNSFRLTCFVLLVSLFLSPFLKVRVNNWNWNCICLLYVHIRHRPCAVRTPLMTHYGVATISRLLKIISLFCKRLFCSFAKETYNFRTLLIFPTSSHPTYIYQTNT